MANKIAQISFTFWVMKILATTLGETAGDLLSMTLGIGYGASSLLLIAFFGFAVLVQLRAQAFHPALYWAVILSTSTAGTTISDYMDRSLALGYAAGTAIVASLLLCILLVWRVLLGPPKVDHISDRATETFYWAAILASNTLGTALGDFLADSSGLGYLYSNAVISAGIVLCMIAYRATRMSRTALFWITFVLTRPFGATMGDLLTKPMAKGGLDLGTALASAILATGLIMLVITTSPRTRPEKSRAMPNDPVRL